MTTIIKNHFQAIEITGFRRKSLRKGRKLMESFHVSNVFEERRDNYTFIQGTVLRETPGANSTRKNENLYYPVIEVFF